MNNRQIINAMLLTASMIILTACVKSEGELYDTCASGLVCIENSSYYEIRLGDGFLLFSPLTYRFYNDHKEVEKVKTYGTGGIILDDNTVLTSQSVVTAPPIDKQEFQDILLTDLKKTREWLNTLINIEFSLDNFALLQRANKLIKALETGDWKIIPHSEYRVKYVFPETQNQIFAEAELIEESKDLPYAKLHLHEYISEAHIFPLAAQTDKSNGLLTKIRNLIEGKQELYIIGYEGITGINEKLPLPTMSAKFENKSVETSLITLPSGETKGRNGNLIINRKGEIVGIINESQGGVQGINLEASSIELIEETEKN